MDPFDPLDYFFLEEFIFPEQGGVTGTCRVHCPRCQSSVEVEVDLGNPRDLYRCGDCGGMLAIDWVSRTIAAVDE